jgi:hypothetical protein
MNRCAEELGLALGVSGVFVRRHRLVGTCRSVTHSSGGAVVVVQHAAQALAPQDWSNGHKAPCRWNDQPIAQPLVIALGVVQVGNRTPILGNYETFVTHGIPGATAR